MAGTGKNISTVFKLVNLAAQLRKVGTTDFNGMFVDNFEKSATRLIKKEFRAKLDADGKPWRPARPHYTRGGKLIKKPFGSLMVTTGRLRDSFEYWRTKNGVKIVNRTPYAIYHQSNAPRAVLPRRTMIPGPEPGVGAPWAEVFNKAMAKTMRDWLKLTRRKRGE